MLNSITKGNESTQVYIRMTYGFLPQSQLIIVKSIKIQENIDWPICAFTSCYKYILSIVLN